MTCGKCEAAVSRLANKAYSASKSSTQLFLIQCHEYRALESAGVKDYSVDLEKQKVLVTSSLSAETVKDVVERTGRTAGIEIFLTYMQLKSIIPIVQ